MGKGINCGAEEEKEIDPECKNYYIYFRKALISNISFVEHSAAQYLEHLLCDLFLPYVLL